MEILDVTTRHLLDALVEQRDVFMFVKDSFIEQSFEIDKSHAVIQSQITDEHGISRHKILEGVRAEHAETRRVIAEIQVYITT